ncbi:hypothetical protein BJP44_01505 [Candidatus Williamhamiltonella defendens]|uniref:Tight adherance operon protein n=1 Tax=Hamiltonella defensa subsp. Acyrthosiphon pisum (strain 5AT) TaxID=572265 RepID=C4K3D7_HAMD5|nr:hypothetical protein [Candidatus Hamiltonella defensa]ACQ67080.1 hypothetical protein HDEF_0318 [Candidatus Hamiltonella defensa 5AT (Acyrthosiphon pisum)]ATW21863.1 hypothetical protein BJP44_01505 [Candidatus Hamiltonella defensa]
MNYRVVLLFSILIIVIGVFGLLTNNKDDKKDLITNATNVISEKKVYVLLAKAKENLAIGALLNNKDYILSHQELPESSPLVKNNLSPLSSIEGFLLKNNLEKNAYITRTMIAEPESPDFIKFNLESGKMIYTFKIGKKNQYLLNLFHPGDHVSLQLRTAESSNSNQINNPDHISIKSNNSSTNNNQDYVLTKIIPDIQIVSIKKYSDEESSKINKNNKNYTLGYIDVSIKVSDLETIFMTEQSGDLILVPMKGSSQENKLSTIMPKLKVIKELRG